MKVIRICTSALAIAAAVALLTIAAPVAGHAQNSTTTPWGCTMQWQPVCGIGKDGKKHTWANSCWAQKDGAKHVKNGACK